MENVSRAPRSSRLTLHVPDADADNKSSEIRTLKKRLKNLLDLKLVLESSARSARASFRASLNHVMEYAEVCRRISESVQRIQMKSMKASYPSGIPVLTLWCNDCSPINGRLPFWKFPLRTFKNEGGTGFAPYCNKCKNARMRRIRELVKSGAGIPKDQSVHEIAAEIAERAPRKLINAIAEPFEEHDRALERDLRRSESEVE